MAQVGDKFEIEIEDVFENEDGEELYRIKGFRSLVFDEQGIRKLHPVGDMEELALDYAGNEINRGDDVIVVGGDDECLCHFTDEMKRFIGGRYKVSDVYSNILGEKRIKLEYTPSIDTTNILGAVSDYAWIGKWLIKAK